MRGDNEWQTAGMPAACATIAADVHLLVDDHIRLEVVEQRRQVPRRAASKDIEEQSASELELGSAVIALWHCVDRKIGENQIPGLFDGQADVVCREARGV